MSVSTRKIKICLLLKTLFLAKIIGRENVVQAKPKHGVLGVMASRNFVMLIINIGVRGGFFSIRDVVRVKGDEYSCKGSMLRIGLFLCGSHYI